MAERRPPLSGVAWIIPDEPWHVVAAGPDNIARFADEVDFDLD